MGLGSNPHSGAIDCACKSDKPEEPVMKNTHNSNNALICLFNNSSGMGKDDNVFGE
jgi:hypothetical protein